jgi:hypothetical protein
MKRRTGWSEALAHALECEGAVNIEDLAAAIAPGPKQRESIEALTQAAKEEILAGRATLDAEALREGVPLLRAVR